jgi:hypothetical protein
MEDSEHDELKNIIRMVSHPLVRPLTDLGKLMGSGVYKQWLKLGIDRAKAHGDFGALNGLHEGEFLGIAALPDTFSGDRRKAALA